jgi:hypothetical protein
MKTLNEKQNNRFKELLMKAVDGLLDAKEQIEFDTFTSNYEQCKKEWQEFRELKTITGSMRLKEPKKEIWDMYWSNVYNRIERGIAWLLTTIGAVLIAGYAAYQFLINFIPDPSIPLIVKAGVFLLGGGLIALTISILREKLFIRKSDPYKEVQR